VGQIVVMVGVYVFIFRDGVDKAWTVTTGNLTLRSRQTTCTLRRLNLSRKKGITEAGRRALPERRRTIAISFGLLPDHRHRSRKEPRAGDDRLGPMLAYS